MEAGKLLITSLKLVAPLACSTVNSASTARSRCSGVSVAIQWFSSSLNNCELELKSGSVMNWSPSNSQVKAECCMMPSESEATTRQGSGVSKTMPTIDELGTIFVTFGWMVR